MRSSTLLGVLIAALSNTQVCVTQPTAKEYFLSDEGHQHIVDGYNTLWRGDLTLLDRLFDPKIEFHADRFPRTDGNGSMETHIHTREEFREF